MFVAVQAKCAENERKRYSIEISSMINHTSIHRIQNCDTTFTALLGTSPLLPHTHTHTHTHAHIYIHTASPPDDLMQAQSVVGSLQVLEIVSPSVDLSLRSQFLSLLPFLLIGLCSHFTAVRHMAARCITTLAQVDLHHTMEAGS